MSMYALLNPKFIVAIYFGFSLFFFIVESRQRQRVLLPVVPMVLRKKRDDVLALPMLPGDVPSAAVLLVTVVSLLQQDAE